MIVKKSLLPKNTKMIYDIMSNNMNITNITILLINISYYDTIPGDSNNSPLVLCDLDPNVKFYVYLN